MQNDLTERCELSGNVCGTDTWSFGKSCPCAPCQRWLQFGNLFRNLVDSEHRAETAETARDSWHAKALETLAQMADVERRAQQLATERDEWQRAAECSDANAKETAEKMRQKATELATARDEIERLRKAMQPLLRYPDNGYHYCRSCPAGTHNGWKHEKHCSLRQQELDVDAARAVLVNLSSKPNPVAVTFPALPIDETHEKLVDDMVAERVQGTSVKRPL